MKDRCEESRRLIDETGDALIAELTQMVTDVKAGVEAAKAGCKGLDICGSGTINAPDMLVAHVREPLATLGAMTQRCIVQINELNTEPS